MEKSREANKESEQYLHTAVFAVIVGVLMACFERAVVGSLLEQWRARIFLLLNLILLSVLFTSLRFSSSSHCSTIAALKKAIGMDEREKSTEKEERECHERLHVCEEEEARQMELSEEELNERVEAFIAMFRQQLVSDSRRKITRDYSAKHVRSMK